MRMTWTSVVPCDRYATNTGGDHDDYEQYEHDCKSADHHYIMYCHDQHIGPIVITCHRNGRVAKLCIRTRMGNEVLKVSLEKVQRSFLRWLLMKPPSVVDVAKHLRVPVHTFVYERRRGVDEEIVECLNVGVLLMRDGRNTEEVLYGNECSGSVEYTAFLQFLGRHNMVNVAVIRSEKFLFHINTMIVVPKWDMARLERKRHLGNDHILILFKEHPNATVDLPSIASSQNMVVFIVSKSLNRRGYTVKAYKKEQVPGFFYNDYMDDQDSLHQSLRNAEAAVCREPKIAGMLLRKRNFELWEIVRNKLAGK